VHLLDLPEQMHWRLDIIDENPRVTTWPLKRWFRDCFPPGHFD